MIVSAKDHSRWIVKRRWVRSGLTMRDIVSKVSRTGAGDLTRSPYEFEQSVKNSAGGFLATVLLPIALLQRLLFVVIAPVDLVLRLVGRQPWTVEAHRLVPPGPLHRWQSDGWHDSILMRDQVRDALVSGHHLPESPRRPGGH